MMQSVYSEQDGVTEKPNIGHHYRRLFVIARQFGDADPAWRPLRPRSE